MNNPKLKNPRGFIYWLFILILILFALIFIVLHRFQISN